MLVQNILLALGFKIAFLVLPLAGMGTLWMAVFADVGGKFAGCGQWVEAAQKAVNGLQSRETPVHDR